MQTATIGSQYRRALRLAYGTRRSGPEGGGGGEDLLEDIEELLAGGVQGSAQALALRLRVALPAALVRRLGLLQRQEGGGALGPLLHRHLIGSHGAKSRTHSSYHNRLYRHTAF